MKKIDISFEKYRTYIYENDKRFTVEKPNYLCIPESGGHRVANNDGKVFIIANGWLAIEINEADLTF